MFINIVILIIFAMLVIMLINALRYKRPRITQPLEKREVDELKAAENLSAAIRIRTITPANPDDTDFDALRSLQSFLREAYPFVHSTMTLEIVDGYALVYKWKGSDSEKLPVLYMAHQDVVPAGDASLWKYPPFSGEIAEGYIWGRGTLDMKGQLISLMEAAELLIRENFVPGRDIYLGFGYNEESVKETGAREMAKLFKERGMRFEYVIDEGGVITSGKPFGINNLLALVGIAEKGYADFKISCDSSGGHASMPPQVTALGKLSEAILKIERNPMRARIEGPFKEMVKTLLPHMNLGFKFILANIFVFKPLLLRFFARNPKTNAFIRTTFAPTMSSGSGAPNVLPQKASVNINARIASWDTIEQVKKHIEMTIGRDAYIEDVVGGNASPVSDVAEQYKIVTDTLSEIFEDVIPAPYLMVGATDSRFMTSVSNNVFRIMPMMSAGEDIDTIHANNERVSIESLADAIRFFVRMFEKA